MHRSAYDVAVVGAGPAGSTAAALLSTMGHRVALVDRVHFPRQKACAEFLSPGVIETLQRLQLDGALAGIERQSIPGMDVISPRGSRLELRYLHSGRRLAASAMPRYTFDEALVAHASACGAELVEGMVVRAPLMDGETVRGIRGTRGGTGVSIPARLTLVADGARSAMARALGLGLPPRWPVRLGLVAHYEGVPPLPGGFGQMHVGRDGYCGVAPLPGGLMNVGLVVRADSLARSRLSASHFLDGWIQSHPQLREAINGGRPTAPVRGLAPVGSRARRAWVPGAMLIGDAAGFFDPFTGEGIYRALRSAELAAGVAHEALKRNDFSAQALRPYGDARARAFRRKEAVTALVQLFVQYPSFMEYALPRLSRRAVPANTLSAVLADVCDARQFLAPRMLWSALRP